MSYPKTKLMNLEDGQTLLGAIDGKMSDLKSAISETKADIITVADSESSAIKTIPDGADGVPMGVTFAVEPVQDLHGQSSPYPGGGGKNKLPITGSTMTGNGIKFTVVKDSDDNIVSVTATGTASAGATFNANTSCALKAGSYVINGCPSGGASSGKWRIRLGNSSDSFIGNETGSGYSFTLSEDTTVTVKLVVELVGTAVDITFYPMIRLATETDPTFAPYSNICPISGWTEAELTGTGELFETSVASAYITTDGKFTESNTGSKSVVASVTAGTIVINKKQSSVFRIGLFSSSPSNGQQATSYETVDATETQHTITVQNDCYMAVFAVSSSSQTDIADSDAIINSIVVAKNAITTYTIQFGETVYGGTLTVNKDGTGSINVDKVIETIPTITSLNTSAGGIKYAYFTTQHTIEYHVNDGIRVKCENFKSCTYETRGEPFTAYLGGPNQVVIFFDTDTTIEQANAYVNGSKILLYLIGKWSDHSTTLPITVPKIKSLLGVNNLFADTGNILSVDYSADTKLYVDNLFASLTNATGVSF